MSLCLHTVDVQKFRAARCEQNLEFQFGCIVNAVAERFEADTAGESRIHRAVPLVQRWSMINTVAPVCGEWRRERSAIERCNWKWAARIELTQNNWRTGKGSYSWVRSWSGTWLDTSKLHKHWPQCSVYRTCTWVCWLLRFLCGYLRAGNRSRPLRPPRSVSDRRRTARKSSARYRSVSLSSARREFHRQSLEQEEIDCYYRERLRTTMIATFNWMSNSGRTAKESFLPDKQSLQTVAELLAVVEQENGLVNISDCAKVN